MMLPAAMWPAPARAQTRAAATLAPDSAAAPPRQQPMPIAQVYERAMRLALQVIVAP